MKTFSALIVAVGLFAASPALAQNAKTDMDLAIARYVDAAVAAATVGIADDLAIMRANLSEAESAREFLARRLALLTPQTIAPLTLTTPPGVAGELLVPVPSGTTAAWVLPYASEYVPGFDGHWGTWPLAPEGLRVRFTAPNPGTISALLKFERTGLPPIHQRIDVIVAGVAPPPPPPPQLAATLRYDGKLRDRVGQGDTRLAPDGTPDGVLTVTLKGGARTVTALRLESTAPGVWDTISQAGSAPTVQYWVLGVAATLDGPLLNNRSTMAVSVPIADGGSLTLFAADYQNMEFSPGVTLTLTMTFSNGETLVTRLTR